MVKYVYQTRLSTFFGSVYRQRDSAYITSHRFSIFRSYSKVGILHPSRNGLFEVTQLRRVRVHDSNRHAPHTMTNQLLLNILLDTIRQDLS